MNARARLALSALVLLAACRPSPQAVEIAAARPAAPAVNEAVPEMPSRAADPPRAAALREYHEAQRLILAEQDIEAGIAHLESAVALDPGFAEAWYQLGTARLTLAAVARGVDLDEALKTARSGVVACRRALALTQEGSLRTWDAFELSDAVAELRETVAAFGDDARLADDARTATELERWAAARNFAVADEPASPEPQP